jgi:UDP-N-acetylmuramate--alanine ligase
MDKTPVTADIKAFRKVFLVGIGGAGVSALARMLLAMGKEVYGSDIKESAVTKELSALGARVSVGQSASLVPVDTDAVVYSVALTELDPKAFADLEALGKPLFSYPQFLGMAAKEYRVIAIAGTHGKTTTTAMVAKVMMDAGLDPTVVVGSALGNGAGNFMQGKSQWLIVEADEYRRAFLNYVPEILAITNVDLDHLNYFKGIEDIEEAFTALAKSMPTQGHVVVDGTDARAVRIAKASPASFIEWSAVLDDIELSVPGEHNRKNAKIALSIAKIVGIPEAKARESLKGFKNPARRFDLKGKTAKGAPVYDDYAHNPAKVRAAIQGAKEAYPGKKLIAVFQPHTYSRTKTLFEDFVASFDGADEVLISPIFAARESNDASITSEMLRDALITRGRRARSFASFAEISDYVKSAADADSVVLVMGAGDINAAIPLMLS